MRFICGTLSTKTVAAYKKAIHSYRARRFLIKTIEYLQMNKIHAAINEYNKSKVREPIIDDIVYGMVISACYSSKKVT
jgi:hypothetical protein